VKNIDQDLNKKKNRKSILFLEKYSLINRTTTTTSQYIKILGY